MLNLKFHSSVESLVKVCDVVTINCPLHPETENLFDKKIVDSATIEQLGDELTGLVINEKKNMLLLNFDSVEFMSSAALNKLISLNKKVKDAAGQLKLCCLRPEIGEVFKITRLDRVFDIRKDEASGLSAFKL